MLKNILNVALSFFIINNLPFFLNFLRAFLKALNQPFSALFIYFRASTFYVYLNFSVFLSFFFYSLSDFQLETDTKIVFFLNVLLALIFLFFVIVFLKTILSFFKLWNTVSLFYFLSSIYFLMLPFSLLIFSFFCFFLLPNFLKIIFFRFSFGLVLAIFSLIVVYFIYLTSGEKILSFSTFYKQFLPLIFFLILLSSLFYLVSLVNLQLFFTFSLLWNLTLFREFYHGYWSPMILKSSLVWNIFRFCTPAPFFLLGLEELILFWPPLGFLKLQSLSPKPLWLSRFVLHNHINYLPIRLHQDFIKKEVLALTLQGVFDSSSEGHAKFSKGFKALNQNLEILKPMAPRTFSIEKDPRELFAYSVVALFFPENHWSVYHAKTVFSAENIPMLSLDFSKSFKNADSLMQTLQSRRYNFKDPVIFKISSDWFLNLNKGSPSLLINNPSAITSLEDTAKQPALFVSRNAPFLKTALLPLNDIIAINKVTNEVFMFQAKYAYSPEGFLIDRFTNQDFTVIYNAQSKQILIFKKTSFENPVKVLEISSFDKKALVLIVSKLQISEEALTDLQSFYNFQRVIAEKAAKEGPLLPKVAGKEIRIKIEKEDL